MIRLLAPLAAALAFSCAAGGEVRIEPQAERTEPLKDVELLVFGVADDALGGCQVVCCPDDGLTLRRYRDWSNRPVLLFEAELPGAYRIVLVAPVSATQTALAECTIRVGRDPPEPTPDPPVGPLRVLLLYESTTASMPAEQRAILSSKPLRDYLEAHCQMIDGHPAFRYLDRDADTAHLPAALRELFDAAVSSAESLPWVIVDNGSARFNGPGPANIEAAFELFQRYGGD